MIQIAHRSDLFTTYKMCSQAGADLSDLKQKKRERKQTKNKD